jgi:hypothetical protein
VLRPIALRDDNFTPTSRTPWGGTRISQRYKRLEHTVVIGESWELSVEPDFPSITRDGEALRDVLTRDPAGYLGRESSRGSTALLVKLLDAADELSVQIHPDDGYAGLAPGESGKPECWYVTERDPGAGVYLGLREGVTEAAMREALAAGGDVSALLAFVPVEVGDFLLIDAGTAHAIGRGLTLVEPQRVVPGRRGVTYRYWDWNRRYDRDGHLDPAGAPRPLHVAHALAVTRWDAPRGDAFLAVARVRAGGAAGAGPRGAAAAVRSRRGPAQRRAAGRAAHRHRRRGPAVVGRAHGPHRAAGQRRGRDGARACGRDPGDPRGAGGRARELRRPPRGALGGVLTVHRRGVKSSDAELMQ